MANKKLEAIRARLAFVLLLLAFPAHAAEPITGKITRVIDGDTIIVGDTPIRLCGIDAPERGSPGFHAATGYLAHRWSGRLVICLPVGNGTPCDGRSPQVTWSRKVAQCFHEGRDIAESLVAKGYAKDWPKFSGRYYERFQPR